jgi:hypothetical protein
MNAATNPNTLGATHESAEPSTHEQPSSAGSSDGTILMLVPSFCYWWLLSAQILTTFSQCLLRKNIILWTI